MLKNRICVLTIFLVMIISNVCFADGRWFTVLENSERSIFLDTNTVFLYGNAKDPYLDCWIITAVPKEKLTALDHTYIQVNNFSYKIEERTIYKNDKNLGTHNKSNEGWKIATPGTTLEQSLIGIINWVANNGERVTVR